ncbi:MAG: UDP-N-acetylmuramate dehydrogenase [Candidatus Andersenbacteria bacterium]
MEENVSLARYTSLHVGGPARYFFRVTSDEDILTAVSWAGKQQLPFFILGKGSNTLFSDEGYPGVVIHMTDRRLHATGTTLTAASGVFMRQLVNFALDHSLRGLEELAGIPGTVGGAVRGNAGTWSTETKDHLQAVVVLRPSANLSQWEFVTLPASQCQFGYRDSIFKREPNWIIVRAIFSLQQGEAHAGQQLVLHDVKQRHERQPYDAPSAGSIFKNPNKEKGVYAGKLIEAAGLKGRVQGGAEISHKHANFIINRNHARSADIRQLITDIQAIVQKESGVSLEPEIQIV